MPVLPCKLPSHQSNCESVFVVILILSPALKLKSPGCCPSNGYSAVTTVGLVAFEFPKKQKKKKMTVQDLGFILNDKFHRVLKSSVP